VPGPFWLNRTSSCKAWTCRTSSSFEKIDKKTDYGQWHSACQPSLERGGVSTHAVIGSRGVLVLIDDLHPHEALTCVWQSNRHRPGIEGRQSRMNTTCRGWPDDCLVEREEQARGHARILPKPPFLATPAKLNVGLGAIVVLNGNKCGLGSRFL